MQVLKERHSSREFGTKPLPQQVLSNLLWAANGMNRTDSGKLTAPSARDWREIDVYVTMAEGVYRYSPITHTLKHVAAGDIRGLTGVQDFVATAPVNLVYVADLNRMNDAGTEQKALYSATDTGFIAQNAYLFCDSAGLATVVRGSIDRAALGAAMGCAVISRSSLHNQSATRRKMGNSADCRNVNFIRAVTLFNYL